MVQTVTETSFMGPLQKNWKDRLRQLWWEQHFSLDVKCVASAEKKKENLKRCGPAWYSESRRQKRGKLEQEKKTLADLRIMCRMKPIFGPNTYSPTELSCKLGQTSR